MHDFFFVIIAHLFNTASLNTVNEANLPATAMEQTRQMVQEEDVVMERRGSRPALLSKCPKTLYDLWKEYVFGFSGNKLAREFNRHERGAVRHLYSKRLIVWKLADDLVRMGYTVDGAIDRIYSVYGHKTSNIILIRMIIADKKVGGILH